MKKIFCIESDWENTPEKKASILPLLECIKGIYPAFDYIYRTANTKEELIYCLHKFKSLRKIKDDFHAIVFCGHGGTGKINLGNGKNFTEITLKELAEICQEIDNNLFLNHLVHFDSCSTIKTSKKKLQEFKESTGAAAVTGFSKDVEFIDSYALEMILFESLLNEKSIKQALKRFQKKYEKGLCDINKFDYII
jgi:hypothetical protein